MSIVHFNNIRDIMSINRDIIVPSMMFVLGHKKKKNENDVLYY